MLSDQSWVLAIDEIERVGQGLGLVLTPQDSQLGKDAREPQVVVVGGRERRSAWVWLVVGIGGYWPGWCR